MIRRQPPLLGATGVDLGAKPAISIVLPKKKVLPPFDDDSVVAPPCCFYPGLGATNPDDLPDSIELWIALSEGADGTFIATLIRCFDPDCAVRHYSDTGLPTTYIASMLDSGDGWEATTGYGDIHRSCLIGCDNNENENFDFRDTFSNTFTVTIAGDSGSYVVTRPAVTWATRFEPRCTWSGNGFRLIYNDVDLTWHLTGTATIAGVPTPIDETKVPPQSHPYGIYSGIATVA